MGRSVAPGSLSLWTHHLKNLTYHKGYFKLYNSKTTIYGDAVTAGAGSQMYDLYTYLDKYKRVVVGGGGKSVGLGGYVTGGGHSLLSPKFGLAVDQVLQMTIVTPGGKILTINENNHQDLFWAMRGVSANLHSGIFCTNNPLGWWFNLWCYRLNDSQGLQNTKDLCIHLDSRNIL